MTSDISFGSSAEHWRPDMVDVCANIFETYVVIEMEIRIVSKILFPEILCTFILFARYIWSRTILSKAGKNTQRRSNPCNGHLRTQSRNRWCQRFRTNCRGFGKIRTGMSIWFRTLLMAKVMICSVRFLSQSGGFTFMSIVRLRVRLLRYSFAVPAHWDTRSTLQHISIPCNPLQHAATHCTMR